MTTRERLYVARSAAAHGALALAWAWLGIRLTAAVVRRTIDPGRPG